MIFEKDEATSQELNCKIIQCYLGMGKLDKAETEILKIPNNLHSCMLRIQLNFKRKCLPDALAMLSQMPKMDGFNISHFLSLANTNSEVAKLYALRAALLASSIYLLGHSLHWLL